MRTTFKHGVTKLTQKITLNHGRGGRQNVSAVVTAMMGKKEKKKIKLGIGRRNIFYLIT